MPIVHTSDIRNFKQCRRMWNYASPLRLNYVPKRSPLYYTRGRAYHAAFEEFYHKPASVNPAEVYRREFLNTIRAEKRRGAEFDAEEIKEDLRIGEAVLAMFPKWSQQHDDFEVLGIEETGQVPLIEDVDFAYRTDLVVRRRKQLWMVDFKTVESLPDDPTWLMWDEQITGYLKACEFVYGHEFTGAMFTFILHKAPTEPKELKNGGLSVDKRIYTTPEVYYAKLKELGEDPRKYASFLKELQSCIWFKRVEVVKMRDEKTALWEMHKQVARRMTDPNILIYPSPSKINCSRCAYQTPCLAENSGRAPDASLEAEFVQGEPR